MTARKKYKPFEKDPILINTSLPEINSGDTVTPTSLITDNHYLRFGLHSLWNAKRVRRLAGYLDMTEYELASMIMCSHNHMKRYLAKDAFPAVICCTPKAEIAIAAVLIKVSMIGRF